MRATIWKLGFCFALCIHASLANAAKFKDLGPSPGGNDPPQAEAVSADGSVVAGFFPLGLGDFEALRWDKTTGVEGLGDLAGGATDSIGRDVSGDGLTIVGNGTSTLGSEAFRWTLAGGMVGLGDFAGGTFQSTAFGVSHDGSVIVGRGRTAAGPEAFRWDATNGLQSLTGLPVGTTSSEAIAVSSDGTIIAGSATSAAGTEAFLWTAATGHQPLGDLPGGAFTSVPLDISADGATVVGASVSGAGPLEAFRWDAANGMQALGDLPGSVFLSSARSVSGDGRFVVGAGQAADGRFAVLWDETNTIQRIDELLVSLGVDLTGWTLQSAEEISADGRTIVGTGINPQGELDSWLAFVPELVGAPVPGPTAPLVLALLAGGLAAGGVGRIRRG